MRLLRNTTITGRQEEKEQRKRKEEDESEMKNKKGQERNLQRILATIIRES